MKSSCAVLIVLLFIAMDTFGESTPTGIPTAPTPVAAHKAVFGIVDWSLVAAVATARTLDFTSTEECLRRPREQCHEIELPVRLVKNKGAFISFEAGTTALTTWGQFELTKLGHRRLAWVSQSTAAVLVWHTVANNYRLDTTPIRPNLEFQKSPPAKQ